MKKFKKCGNCGSTKLISSKENNFSFPWKDYPSVFISQDYELNICENCHELIFCASEGKMIDELIQNSIRRQVNSFIQKIMHRENCATKEIAERIGVNSYNFAKIQDGHETPSFQTFNFLKTLALSEKSFKCSSPNFNNWKIT